ncbi:cytochrome C biogenesis protein CcsB [Oscillatoriales cyanobacterium USR001]|nr:cytochrome C biogenesis protein CcsB [Oscillatoriales cyanobacterium USR001]
MSEENLFLSKLSNWVNLPQKFFRRELLPVIADLRLAIILLLAIAVFSISGTVIEQGQSVEFYQTNYPENPALFGFLTWKVLLIIGLDRVYHTWWFLSILILFGTSLTACTFTRQFPALKSARNWKFYDEPKQFEKLALSAELTTPSLNSLEQILQKRNYRVFREGNTIYARKGIIGKIGPIIVHASMLIILAGAIVGMMTGFIAQEMIPSGQLFQIRNIVDAGPWAKGQIPKDWGLRVNRFWIDYTPDGNIDQFYSDLSVLDNEGKEVDRQTIHVNKPLKYRGVTLYQADWSIDSVRLRVNNSPILQLPMALLDTQGRGRIWGTWIPTKADLSEGISLVTNDLQGTLLVYGNDGNLLTTIRTGMATEINGVMLTIEEIVGSTGLQVKADPGIPIVYTGFGLLMLSVLMSYVSHSQIWALQKSDRLFVGGRTNRAQVSFEREICEILDKLTEEEKGDAIAPNSLETSKLIV